MDADDSEKQAFLDGTPTRRGSSTPPAVYYGFPNNSNSNSDPRPIPVSPPPPIHSPEPRLPAFVDHTSSGVDYDKEVPAPGHRLRRAKSRLGKLRAKVFTRARRNVGNLPIICLPQKEGHEWLAEGAEVTEWLSLFFDLAVVAVLSVFGGAHELSGPSAIPSFLAYYAIIAFMWAWQVQYDVRYEANDVYHRIFKCLHIMLFIYIGAASAGWDLKVYTTFDPEKSEGPYEHVEFGQADNAFLTVALALVIQRVLLVIQYLTAAGLGRHVGRSFAAPLAGAGSLFGAAIITIIAAALPSTTKTLIGAKIAFLYLSFVWEIAMSALLVWRQIQTPARGEDLAERFGALTLIIIGEGFLNLSRAFQHALDGGSVGDATLYAQVFLVIVIMFTLWGFLFGNFHKNDHVSTRRELLWEGVHFPLHFAILLFLAALVNVVVLTTFGNGLDTVTTNVTEALNSAARTFQQAHNGTTASAVAETAGTLLSTELSHIADSVNRLSVTPDFLTEYHIIQNISIATGNKENDDLRVQAHIAAYLAQIAYSAAVTAGVEIPEGAATALNHLNTFNFTTGNAETANDHASELYLEVYGEIVNDAFQGALWLFPTAGATLILASVRSWLRYKFYGAEHYFLHLIPIVMGFILMLLTLLDIGPKAYADLHALEEGSNASIGKTPIYNLVNRMGSVPVVFAAYLLVAILTMGMNMWIRRRRNTRSYSRTATGSSEEAGTQDDAIAMEYI